MRKGGRTEGRRAKTLDTFPNQIIITGLLLFLLMVTKKKSLSSDGNSQTNMSKSRVKTRDVRTNERTNGSNQIIIILMIILINIGPGSSSTTTGKSSFSLLPLLLLLDTFSISFTFDWRFAYFSAVARPPRNDSHLAMCGCLASQSDLSAAASSPCVSIKIQTEEATAWDEGE